MKKDFVLKIEVKCTCCNTKKTVGSDQDDIPLCDKCGSPMLPTKARKG